MKKIIFLLCALICLTACDSGADKKSETTSYFSEGHAELKFYAGAFQDILDEADLAIEAEVLSEKEDTPIVKENGRTGYGVTKTPVKIIKIIKDNFDVSVEDEIFVWENYFLRETKNQVEHYSTVGGYRPMKTGEKYFLFLKENKEGTYEGGFSIVGVYQGKFAVKDLVQETAMLSDGEKNGKENIEVEIEFGEDGREEYIRLLEQAKESLKDYLPKE